MKRRLALELAGFAREALASQARRLGVPLDRVVREAVLYYVSDIRFGRPAGAFPRFARRRAGPLEGERLELSVEVDERIWRSLDEEAERQRVTPEQLIEHAILYYVSDLEAGRVAARIAERLEEEP